MSISFTTTLGIWQSIRYGVVRWGVRVFPVLLLGYGMVVAAWATGGTEVIHACIARDGETRIVAAEAACRRNERHVAWNVQGPKGNKGPKGDKGDKGDRGDNGEQGVQGIPGLQGLRGDKGEQGERGALSLPDGRCWSDIQRYVDCGNGTVTDQLTGLIWLQKSDCLPRATFAGANEAAQKLKDGDCGLTDGSVSGMWRLPTIAEWQATVARAVALGCLASIPPALTNNAGTGCYALTFDGPGPAQHALTGTPQTLWFWSSTPDEVSPVEAWSIYLANGGVARGDNRNGPAQVWPVRGGPL